MCAGACVRRWGQASSVPSHTASSGCWLRSWDSSNPSMRSSGLILRPVPRSGSALYVRFEVPCLYGAMTFLFPSQELCHKGSGRLATFLGVINPFWGFFYMDGRTAGPLVILYTLWVVGECSRPSAAPLPLLAT